MKRRNFLAVMSGALASPLVATEQQPPPDRELKVGDRVEYRMPGVNVSYRGEVTGVQVRFPSIPDLREVRYQIELEQPVPWSRRWSTQEELRRVPREGE